MKRVQLCFAAYSGEPPTQLTLRIRELIEALVETCKGVELRVFLGGYRGLMKVIADEFAKRRIPVVLVIPRDYEGVDEPPWAIIVRTGMDSKGRSVILVRSCDVVVVAGGASGTLMEAVAAYGMGVPVIYLTSTGLPTDRFAEAYRDGVLDERVGRGIWFSENPREAAELACSFALGGGLR